MNNLNTLIKMLTSFLDSLSNIQQKGAGYYSCNPFIKRYNSLLEVAKKICKNNTVIIETFAPIENIKSADPADKIAVLQEITIESQQLITFLRDIQESDNPTLNKGE